MGRSLVVKLRATHEVWNKDHDDSKLLSDVLALAEEFAKEPSASNGGKRLRVEDLELICFEYVSS